MIQVTKQNNFTNLEPIERYFKYAKEGNHYVRITKSRPKRSTLQNAYYWGMCVKILSDELGYTKGCGVVLSECRIMDSALRRISKEATF